MAVPIISGMTIFSALQEPLPDLKVSSIHTTNHALHPIHYIGILEPWPNFAAEVTNTFTTQTWSPGIIEPKVVGPNAGQSTSQEQVFVACETDVQGRLLGRAGQILGVAFKVQRQDLLICSFKGAVLPRPNYRKVPDFVIMDQYGVSKVVGEVKVPWVPKHSLRTALNSFGRGLEKNLRHLLGQIASYMRETNRKYGVLTSYEQTVCLRKVDVNRHWVLQFSPVIFHDNKGDVIEEEISLSQSLYHLALLGQEDPDFGLNTGIRNQAWTRAR